MYMLTDATEVNLLFHVHTFQTKDTEKTVCAHKIRMPRLNAPTSNTVEKNVEESH